MSLTVVALTVPFDPLAPETTTRSPGRTAFLPTLTFLVTLVALDSVTLTVLPEVSVTYSEFPLMLLTVPNVALPPAPAPPNSAAEAPSAARSRARTGSAGST